jgi:hypothetical protein
VILDQIDIKHRKFTNLITKVNNYKNKEYYKSKAIRINYIKDIPTDEIILNILIKTIPCNKFTPIQAICSSLAYKFSNNIVDGVKTTA